MAEGTSQKGGEEMKPRRKRGDGSVYLRGRIYWIKYSVNGESVCESSGSDKEPEARKFLRKRLGEIVTGNFIGPDAERVTVAELADDVVTDYKVNEQDSLDKAERSAKRIKEFFGNARAHSVKGDSVKKFIAKRQADGAANATINRELAFLKRAYNLGIEAEKIVRKPYVPQLKEDNVRTGFFEYGEFVAVRNACPDYFKPVVTFAYYTGWRKEEILSLRWSQIDLQAEEIRLEVGTDKNDAGRVIAMDGELLETIKAQWERRKVAAIPGHSPTLLCPYVFHRMGKLIGGKRGDIRDAWHNACVTVGLGQMIEVECKGKKTKKYVGKFFHDFRRTGIRDMIRAGTPERVVMMISGHKTRSVFDRYNIVSSNDLKEAARRRAEYAAEQEEKARKVVAMNRG
jgi:integrase